MPGTGNLTGCLLSASKVVALGVETTTALLHQLVPSHALNICLTPYMSAVLTPHPENFSLQQMEEHYRDPQPVKGQLPPKAWLPKHEH